ncbi:MAG: hypothetical protein ABI567_00060 [Gammaproteobacteria bacterium]
MTTILRNPLMLATVYGLALASILVTRVLKAFTLAEALAVAAFLCGLFLLWQHRRRHPGVTLPLPERLILIGSLLGLAGLPLKLLFILLGIGAASHDMANHETSAGNPLLLHIHHLFFNLGFLLLLISAIAWMTAAIRRGRS